jgi:hypothetical protein
MAWLDRSHMDRPGMHRRRSGHAFASSDTADLAGSVANTGQESKDGVPGVEDSVFPNDHQPEQ